MSETEVRSIFISVPHGTSAGNVLRAGGLLDRLQEFDSALKIVLLSPLVRDAARTYLDKSRYVKVVLLPEAK